MVKVDNFFSDVEKERCIAVGAKYEDVSLEKPGGGRIVYPGISSLEPGKTEGWDKFAGMLGRKDEVPKGHAFYRRYLEGEPPQPTFIHSDKFMGDYGCVVWLNRKEDCKGGLAFWKHKSTALECPPSAAAMAAVGWEPDDGWLDRLQQDGMWERYWEMVDYVPAAENRAVIFTAHLFHSRYPLDCAGKDIETCRITKNFFLG